MVTSADLNDTDRINTPTIRSATEVTTTAWLLLGLIGGANISI